MSEVSENSGYYIKCPDGTKKLSASARENTNKKRAEEGKSTIEQAYYEMILLEETKKGKPEEQAKKTAEQAKARFTSDTCDGPSAVAPVAPVAAAKSAAKKWAPVQTTVPKRGGKRKTRKSRRGKKSKTRRC